MANTQLTLNNLYKGSFLVRRPADSEKQATTVTALYEGSISGTVAALQENHHDTSFNYSQSPSSSDLGPVAAEMIVFITRPSSSVELANFSSEYTVLQKTLVGLQSDDELRVGSQVYNQAIFIAALLNEKRVPTPGIFTHGSDAVVFNWKNHGDRFYLTLDGDSVSMLLTSPEGVKQHATLQDARLTGDFISALKSISAITPQMLPDRRPTKTR